MYKYSKIAWDFIKEKYINVVPFGKELLQVINEIIYELKQIENIPSVKFILDKWYDMYNNMRYYYNYLGLQYKLQNFIRVIYKKFWELSITALDVENRYILI